MMNDEQLKSLYFDMHISDTPIEEDDFLVAIGKKQSNSVYHVAQVRHGNLVRNGIARRYYLKVYKSDLPTALRRDPEQRLLTIQWYSRDKKKA